MLVPFPAGYKYTDPGVTFSLVGRGRTAGVGLSGAITRVASASAHWRATVSFALHGDEAFLQWQQFLAQMQGTLGETFVPVWPRVRPLDINGQQFPRDDYQKVGQVQIAVPYQTHVSVLQAALAVGDTRLLVQYLNTTEIRPGHVISMDGSLHEVTGVTEISSAITASGSAYFLDIDPPNRAERLVGTPVNIDRPFCRMRFATEDEGRIPHNTSSAQTVTVNFVEVFS